jgi:hypothetical protein
MKRRRRGVSLGTGDALVVIAPVREVQMRVSTRAAVAAACSFFTVAHVAWADDAQSSNAPGAPEADLDVDHGELGRQAEGATDPRWLDSPYAPHHPHGVTMRAGTSVGYVYGKRLDVLALGGGVALGHRWNRITIEASYDFLRFSELGPSSLGLGHAHRAGVTGRIEPLRFGSDLVGENSMLAVYVEAGVARVQETWYRPKPTEPSRVVPDGGGHGEAVVGLGLLLDHRLERPSKLSRVGWLLGWRAVAAPNAPEDYVLCRGVSCARTASEMPMKREYETALLFTSSLELTW